MKAIILIGLVVAGIILGLFFYMNATGKMLVGHYSLHREHMELANTQTNIAKLMDAQHTELNRKLDILLNIATNSMRDVRSAP